MSSTGNYPPTEPEDNDVPNTGPPNTLFSYLTGTNASAYGVFDNSPLALQALFSPQAAAVLMGNTIAPTHPIMHYLGPSAHRTA